MSSERRTDNYQRNRARERRRRNRRIILVRSIVLVILLIALALLALFVYKKIKEMQITDWYDEAAGFKRIISVDKQIDELPVYASEKTVISHESTDEAFTAGAGLVVKTGGGSDSWAFNPYERLNPASTTKVMTALLAIKYADLTDQVTITEGAMIDEPGASLAGLKVGDTYALRQLLYGLMLPSGNDAAAAIAIHMCGSVEAFADLMNEEASKLGCVDTHFTNPHGITDENHYTSAYDLYLMLDEAMKYDEFLEICQTKSYTAEYYDNMGLAQSKTWKNSNKYVNGDRELLPGLEVVAGKTGTTVAAGNCLVLGTAESSGDTYISIVLNAATRPVCYDNMDFLLQKIYN